MPRNTSGVYSLPESAFVAGTTIRSAPVNSDFSDIADALTESLATTGVSTMTGPFKAANGSVTAPSITFGASSGTGWYRVSDNVVAYVVAGELAITYNSDKSVDFEAAISVGNADDAGTDKLDWYEEGTFTPALEFGGATTGITYSARVGKYTRIGNVVFFDINIILTSNGTATGDATVSGLPYANNASVQANCVLVAEQSVANEGASNFAGIIEVSTSEIRLVKREIDEDSISNMDNTDIVDDSEFSITGHYRV